MAEAAEAGPVDESSREQLRLLEAILFAAAEPVPLKALAARLPGGADVLRLLRTLQARYEGGGVVLRQAGVAWAFRTAPDLAPLLRQDLEVARKMGRATVEVLAIIAYHQPITRAEIEEIRGVGLSKGTMDALFEAGWIRPKGRRQTPGRPVTWGTTDLFLDHFGLGSLADLPGVAELKAAGLLDARPAIEAYSVSGAMEAMPMLPFDGPDGEPDEPLDPDPDDESEPAPP